MVGGGLQVGDVRNEEDHLEELFDPGALLRGDFARDDLAAVFFDEDVVVGELLLHAVGTGVRLVDFVDGDDDRNAGSLRVVDGFDGLRLDAIVRGDYEHHDVGDADAPRPHQRERLVTWRVEKVILRPRSST